MTEYFVLPKHNGSCASASLDEVIQILDNEVTRCCVCDYIEFEGGFVSEWGSCDKCKNSICTGCIDKNDTEDSGLPLSCYDCYYNPKVKDKSDVIITITLNNRVIKITPIKDSNNYRELDNNFIVNLFHGSYIAISVEYKGTRRPLTAYEKQLANSLGFKTTV